MKIRPTRTAIAQAWCLGWEIAEIEQLQAMRQALGDQQFDQVPAALKPICHQIGQMQTLEFPNDLATLQSAYPELWQQSTPIGLVYGGATKIKSYVFEDAKLPDIRGASALLDQVLDDLAAFFHPKSANNTASRSPQEWLCREFPNLAEALIPELVIYSTGGNILTFCPAPFVDDLADAIEKRYITETLTANACAVGDTFRLLEMRLGRLSNSYEKTPWLDNWYQQAESQNPILAAYFDTTQGDVGFQERKSFSELVTCLAALFNQRRNGNPVYCKRPRPSRNYPPMFETHPYLRRDSSDHRLAVMQPSEQAIPSQPWLSDTLARKRVTGQITKRASNTKWFEESINFDWTLPEQTRWQPQESKSWVAKFKDFLDKAPVKVRKQYYQDIDPAEIEKIGEARDLSDIGDASKKYVAYIYADGNNMGGYIQKQIKTPEEYASFSQDIFNATQYSVYIALAQHLHPQHVKGNPKDKTGRKADEIIHPFEIVTIGGDDVFIIVPADQAVAIAHTIGTIFEKILLKEIALPTDKPAIQGCYRSLATDPEPAQHHRYDPKAAIASDCVLSISSGVLITAQNTPIYYAEQLTTQLLKSAKKKAKQLNAAARKQGSHYLGGTVDFLVMKSVTMLAASVQAYRDEALTVVRRNLALRLYAAPYTLHELEGLIETVRALRNAKMGRSQLYQIRSFLTQGKRTAMLNYRYFQSRLDDDPRRDLRRQFDEKWCEAQTNSGNLSPWRYVAEDETVASYETIWRDLVDLLEFVSEASRGSTQSLLSPSAEQWEVAL